MMTPLPALDPSRAIAYRRVSSAEQSAETGPERQRRSIRAFAQREGLDIVGDVFEDRSGTLPMDERPGLQQALADALRLGAGTLIVEDRSRLARDEYAAFDALRTFRGSGVRVMYADGSNGGDGADAQLVDSIQHAIAASERRRIVAKLRAGRTVAAERAPDARKQGGPVPFGYRRTRDGLDLDPQAAEIVRRIFELARSGASLAKIAAEVESTGAPRSRAALAELLRNDLYKRARPGRIVDPRIWGAANAALDGRRKRP